jgi:hypothetical protein
MAAGAECGAATVVTSTARELALPRRGPILPPRSRPHLSHTHRYVRVRKEVQAPQLLLLPFSFVECDRAYRFQRVWQRLDAAGRRWGKVPLPACLGDDPDGELDLANEAAPCFSLEYHGEDSGEGEEEEDIFGVGVQLRTEQFCDPLRASPRRSLLIASPRETSVL